MPRLGYLCLQVTRHGQASHAHVHEIISGLRRRGWTVELFEPTYRRDDGSTGVPERLFQFALVQWRLWRKMSDLDVLYLRTHFGAFPACIMARIKGLPVVHEVNGPHEDLFIAWPRSRWIAPVFKTIRRLELEWADAVISVTRGLAEWVESITGRGEASVHVIGNGANTELFRPGASSRFELPEKYVSWVGALARWQGIETLLHATKEKIWPADVSLVVVGGDREAQWLEDEGSFERVVFLGRIPYEDVPGVVAGGLAGLCPCKNLRGRASTGLSPLKVFEALACGVPIVVTDFPGQADLVRSGECGFVVPPERPRALAEAVHYLNAHRDERMRMGERGRRLVVEEHSWDAKSARTHEILTTVLRDSPSPSRNEKEMWDS